MAGGKHAHYVPCIRCGQKAERIQEGTENDTYECTVCGHEFIIHWEEPPEEPQWPVKETTDENKRSESTDHEHQSHNEHCNPKHE
ncbi:hypothetical protein GF342_03190 [Candidatus Woesearchaeota archaeon]|nr:hypothetical protein [Candidatus Woesearchaeota archaeon]